MRFLRAFFSEGEKAHPKKKIHPFRHLRMRRIRKKKGSAFKEKKKRTAQFFFRRKKKGKKEKNSFFKKEREFFQTKIEEVT